MAPDPAIAAIKPRLLTFVQDVQKSPESTELEALLFPGHIDGSQFTSLVKYLVSTLPNSPVVTDQLNVMFMHRNETHRLEIEGLPSIAEYCNTNRALPEHRLIKKSIGRHPPIREQSFKVNLKDETDVVALRDDVLSSHEVVNKRYRLKRRLSFYSTDGNFRYDLSVVKSSPRDATTVAGSGVTTSAPGYEVEIEYVANSRQVAPSVIVTDFLVNILELLAVLRGQDASTLLPANLKRDIVKYYKKVAGLHRDEFLGPMPVTLERANMAQGEFWDYHILKDYTVTDKADGERRLLFVHSNGQVYMLDKELTVTPTGASANGCAGSILDGEYITLSRKKEQIKHFMVFDCYYFKEQSVAKEHLLKRHESVEKVIAATVATNGFKLQLKAFYRDIFAGAKAILDLNNTGAMPYIIDGLVYTPKWLPVGAMFKGKSPKLGNTWARVFKWKPAEDNSIDFLVKIRKNNAGEDTLVPLETGGYGKVLVLFVGYKRRYNHKISVESYLAGEVPDLETYFNEPFAIPSLPQNLSETTVPIHEQDGFMRCKNGEIITHNSVVEMALVAGPSHPQWEPLRLRKDKTRGNDYTVAVNIYRSIMNPVLESDVRGETNVELEEEDENADGDIYYKRIYPREMSAIYNMLAFHNEWVKRKHLIDRFANQGTRVFDIACGRGGDLRKYVDNKVKIIVGVDKSADNITSGKDGAYARWLQAQSAIKPNTIAIFVPLDFAKPFPKDDAVWNFLTNTNAAANPAFASKYKNIVGVERFGLVSCQFAIHYFMETRAMFRQFLANLDTVIADGGYFIGTCLDAHALDDAFAREKVEHGGMISGRYGSRTIWNIRKLYDSLGAKDNWGKKVKVYIETINQAIDEYLVDFNMMQRELKRIGLEPPTTEECKALGLAGHTGMFSDVFEALKTSTNIKAKSIVKDMSDDEKRYSFLNRWFVFKKQHKSGAQQNV